MLSMWSGNRQISNRWTETAGAFLAPLESGTAEFFKMSPEEASIPPAKALVKGEDRFENIVCLV
jgi:hypothetical protein